MISKSFNSSQITSFFHRLNLHTTVDTAVSVFQHLLVSYIELGTEAFGREIF